MFARSKPAEQLSPTATASPSDWDAKVERKKSQPSHVGTPPPASLPPSPSRFSARSSVLSFCPLNQPSKTNAQYHKLFKEVGKDEPLRQSQSSSFTPLLPRTPPAARFPLANRERRGRQATRAPCRETSCTRARCSSPTTGSASTPKSSAKTPRFSHRKIPIVVRTTDSPESQMHFTLSSRSPSPWFP